jgi:valyl-tRNA synthetase
MAFVLECYYRLLPEMICLFDEALCEQGRNFATKIWNAFRLVKGWNVGDVKQSDADKISIEWFNSRHG